MMSIEKNRKSVFITGWWLVVLLPFYGLAELIPALRKPARSKALVTIRQMLQTLLVAVEMETNPLTIFEIRDIRRGFSKKSAPLRTVKQEPSYLV